MIQRYQPTSDAPLQSDAIVPRRTVPADQQCEVTLVAHDVGGTGGMERQLAELAIGLRRLGHQVSVIARTCDLPASAGIAFHRIHAPRRPFLLSYPWFMLAGSLAVRRRRRGIVLTAGAIVLNRVDTIAVHCCHRVYNSVPADRRSVVRWYFRLVGLVKRTGERWCFSANSTATLVCVSNGVADEVREHYPESASRVVTIHNGVDLTAFSPGRREADGLAFRASLGISSDRLVAVFVGGNWEHKGLRFALEALAKAPEWDLVVAGRGNRRQYQELARSLGVAGAVHWLGVVSDIQPVYESADAFVLPSRYETFSLVTFEAAASGLPVLVTPVSGVGELIEDTRNGYLISADADTIARRLRELAANPDLRARLGEAIRESALRFGWERMVAKHDQLFARLGS
jgi:glycosyltransferase involved in cell wall biosynthesis